MMELKNYSAKTEEEFAIVAMTDSIEEVFPFESTADVVIEVEKPIEVENAA